MKGRLFFIIDRKRKKVSLSDVIPIKESYQKVTSFAHFIEYDGSYQKEKEDAAYFGETEGFVWFLFVCFVLVWLVRPPHSEKVLGLNPVWSLFEWPLRGDLSGYLSFHPQSKDRHGVRFTGNSNLPVGINAFLSLCAAHWQLRCTSCTLPLALWQMGKAPAPLRAEESMVWSDTVYVWPNYAHWNPKTFTR